jgi:hypothetical protein
MDPAQMRKLVWIHAGRKPQFVGFVMAPLILLDGFALN